MFKILTGAFVKNLAFFIAILIALISIFIHSVYLFDNDIAKYISKDSLGLTSISLMGFSLLILSLSIKFDGVDKK